MRVFSIILAAAFILPAPELRAEDAEVSDGSEEASSWDAKITDVQGSAYIFESGQDDGVPASKGVPLENGDRVVTGSDGSVEIAFESDSIINLGRNTTFTVDMAAQESSHFTLTLGSLVAKFRAFWGGKPRWAIYTPTAVAAVRGTEFLLEVAEDGETTIGVFDEGQVAVSVLDDPGVEETLLGANEQTTVGHGKGLRIEERSGRKYLRKKKHQRKRRMLERMKKLRARRHEFRKTWKRMSLAKRQRKRKLMRERRGKLSPKRRGQIKRMMTKRSGALKKRRGHLKGWKQRRGMSMKKFRLKVLKRRAGQRKKGVRNKVRERKQGYREKVKERRKGAREKVKERRKGYRDKVKDRRQGAREKVKGRRQGAREKVKGRRDKVKGRRQRRRGGD